jgi:hypothetical protein
MNPQMQPIRILPFLTLNLRRSGISCIWNAWPPHLQTSARGGCGSH